METHGGPRSRSPGIESIYEKAHYTQDMATLQLLTGKNNGEGKWDNGRA